MLRTMTLLVLACVPVAALCQRADNDSLLVGPYLQFATKDGITVMWETTSPATATVEYGEALLNAKAPNLSMTAKGEEGQTLHEIRLEGLRTGTKYVYRVRSRFASGAEAVSAVYTFATAVADSTAYAFAVIGDTQRNSRTPWAWGKVAQQVWRERPNFIVHLGDIVDTGSRKSDWTEDYFRPGHVVLSRYPAFTVLGNHEQDDQHYYDYMSNPEPEYWYTFRYGNADFFMLDSNRDMEEGSEQYDWLEWQLAKSDARWKFAVHHHPPYSSEENDHGDTYVGASSFVEAPHALVPLYERYGVDFCLFGHTHVYERTWPIFEERVNTEKGVVYINSGGAGGGLEDFDPVRSWFSHKLKADHHFVTFTIHGDNLTFRAIDHDGHLFDSFETTRPKRDRAEGLVPPPPRPSYRSPVFDTETEVTLEPHLPGLKIRYTLDGSEPGAGSRLYDGPVRLTSTCTLRARTFGEDGKAGREVRRQFRKMRPIPGVTVKNPRPGLRYSYYELDGELDRLPDFSGMTPIRTGVMPTVGYKDASPRDDLFALVLEGYVEVPSTGLYTFWTRSDDGSKLYVHGETVVDNDGDHGACWRFGDIYLEEGFHPIRIEYFENFHGQMLRAGMLHEGGKRQFTVSQLSH